MQPCIYLNHFRLTINRVFLWHISSIFQTRHTIPIPAQVPVEKKFQNPHGIIILKPLFQFKLSWQANTCTLVQKGNQKSSAKTQPLPDQFLPNQQKTQFQLHSTGHEGHLSTCSDLISSISFSVFVHRSHLPRVPSLQLLLHRDLCSGYGHGRPRKFTSGKLGRFIR